MVQIDPVNPSSPAPVGRRRAATIALFIVVIGAVSACAELLFGRAVPWGERVRVEAWATLAMPLDIEQAFERTVAAQDEPEQPSLGRRMLDAVARVFDWAAEVELEIRTDIAAIVVESRTTALARLPGAAQVAGGRVRLGIERTADDGTLVLTVGGGYTCTLRPGEGADVALVPLSDGQPWQVIADDWREVIQKTLSSGRQVGRLSIVNHGLGPANPRKE